MNSKSFTISGDKNYIKRVADNAASIEGVTAVQVLRPTSALIIYDPEKTDIGGINKLLRQYRSEKAVG